MTADPATQLYNWKPTNTRAWRRATARALSGGNARINCFGPSTVAGYYAGVGRSESAAWPAQLRRLLNWRFGTDGGTGVIYFHEPDPRVSAPGWNLKEPYGPYGASCFSQAGAGAPLTFGPVIATGFRVTYLAGPGAGHFRLVSDDPGRIPLDVDCNAASWQVRTVATPAGNYGSHKLSVSWASGGPVFIVGVEGYVGPTSSWAPAGITVTNTGKGSTVIANLLGTGQDWTGSSLGAAVDANPADLSIVAYVENSPGYQTPEQMKTDMRVLLDRIRATGSDLLLVTSIDWQGESPTMKAPQELYNAAVYELADEYDVPLFDLALRWGRWEDSWWYYSDNIHPLPVGYADIAGGLCSALLTGVL